MSEENVKTDDCIVIKKFLCYEGENATKHLMGDPMSFGWVMAKHFNALGLQGLAMIDYHIHICDVDTRVVCEARCRDLGKMKAQNSESNDGECEREVIDE